MPSPESFGPVKGKHLRILERRINFLQARISAAPDPRKTSFDRQEIAAMRSILADLRDRYPDLASQDEDIAINSP